ncbi:MAG: hypothetical protein KDK61_03670, partial [Simkania sp.]|nr:hypothetical protein [Simkania sp.]
PTVGYGTTDIVYDFSGEVFSKIGAILLAGSRQRGILAIPVDQATDRGKPAFKKVEHPNQYFLCIAPGGAHACFNQENVDVLMKEVVQKLVGRDLHLVGVSSEVGRHPGETFACFKNWQEKMSS